MKFLKVKNRSGQTIVIIFMAMLLSLSVGIAISSGFIKRLHLFTRIDFSTKAIAVAESLVERLLLLPSSTLDDYVNNGTCGSDCALSITDEDGITSSAVATLEFLGNASEEYASFVNAEEVTEINLLTYPTSNYVDVCWENANTALYASYIKISSSEYKADPYAYNPSGSSFDNGFDTATPMYTYPYCFRMTTANTPVALRVKALYDGANVTIVPSAGNNLPKQGYLITSTGTAGDAVKKVSVAAKNPFLPAIFDNVLYQKSDTEALSN